MIVYKACKSDIGPKQTLVEYDRETEHFFIRKNSKQRDKKISDYEFLSTDINAVWEWLKNKREFDIRRTESSIQLYQAQLVRKKIKLEEFMKNMPKDKR